MLFQEMLDNQTDKAYMLSLVGSLLTKIALTFFPDAASRVRKASTDPVLIELAQLINAHFKEHLPAAEYARKLNLSLSALERKIKEASGKSVTALQQERLLKEAKRLLCQPGFSVKETAWKLGFREAAHFSNWFKKWTQASPLSFAKALGASFLFTVQPVLEQLPI
jgi:AraC family transcriptional activator of pobA